MDKSEVVKNTKFQQQIKYERELRGWSQAKLAGELGTTPNTVSLWERGLSHPSAYFREKLCTLLNKNAQELGLVQEVEERPVLLEESLASPIIVPIVPHEKEDMHEAATIEQPSRYSPLPEPPHRNRLLIIGVFLLLIVVVGWIATLILPGILNRSANPYAPYQGTLVLNDTLRDQSKGVNWQEGVNENHASCQFKNGKYYSFQPLVGYFHACFALTTNFRNFAYETEMTLATGDYGGIIFRARNSIDSRYYLFRVYTNGSYALKLYVDKVDDHAPTLNEGVAKAFHSGFNQKNLIAVVAEDARITLYVNRQAVVAVSDTSYAQGQIGVFAGNDTHSPAEAAFSNVKVWAW